MIYSDAILRAADEEVEEPEHDARVRRAEEPDERAAPASHAAAYRQHASGQSGQTGAGVALFVLGAGRWNARADGRTDRA